MADRLYPLLHQLLSSKEPAHLSEERWGLLTQRLRELIEERFNTRRAAVQNLLNTDQFDGIVRQFVLTLALSSGSGGNKRLRASLLDNLP